MVAIRVGIICYGGGNINSLISAFERVGTKAVSVSDGESLESVDAIVLPGVGSFDMAIKWLVETGLLDSVKNRIVNGTPTLDDTAVVGYKPVESFIGTEPVLTLPLRIVILVEPALK